MPISEASLGIITCIFAIYVDLILMRWPNAGTINWNSSFIRFWRCWRMWKMGSVAITTHPIAHQSSLECGKVPAEKRWWKMVCLC